MNVIVVPYNDKWPEAFQKEAALIRRALGGNAVNVFHIGSTAVPGLPAKPIIDIMPVVKDINAVEDAPFEALGYAAKGEYGIPGRRFFMKGGSDRTHHVHAFEAVNAYAVLRHLLVRDYLRANAGAADAYGSLKRRLAAEFPKDIEGYCDGKDAFVKGLEAKAFEWYWASRD